MTKQQKAPEAQPFCRFKVEPRGLFAQLQHSLATLALSAAEFRPAGDDEENRPHNRNRACREDVQRLKQKRESNECNCKRYHLVMSALAATASARSATLIHSIHKEVKKD